MKLKAFTLFILLTILLATTACGEKAPSTPTAVVGQRPTATSVPPTATTAHSEGEGVSTNAEWTPVVQEFDGVEMVLVPAGCFMMGSTEEEIDAAFEVCKSASTPVASVPGGGICLPVVG